MARINPETVDAFPIHKFMAVLSELLSEQYGCQVTIRAIPKDEAVKAAAQQAETSEQKAG